MKAAMTAAVTKLIQLVKAALALKFDKAGGEISGNVKIGGNLTLDIPNEDYDAGITLSKTLDDNLGTILQLQGYAHGEEQTWYRAVLRGVAEPSQNYDAANKKYVDDHVALPTYHLVFLNADGTVDTHASTLVYATVLSNLSNPMKSDYLDVFWGDARFYAKCIETIDVNTGDLKFIAEVEYHGMQRYMVFTLTPQGVLSTTNIVTFESIHNKAQSVTANSQSADKYPSTAAVFNEIQRKPVTIWEVDGVNVTAGLNALQTNIDANMEWQLTGLDLTPFKRIKVYSKGSQGSTNASTTGAMVLEMSLDPRMAIATKGGHYVGSVLSQKPNDSNRYASLTCAVSADKTSFAVLRQTSLYGTAATTNADIGASVVLIEGYYD